MAPMYPNYGHYGPQGYYGMPPQFQNGGVPSGVPAPGYAPYQAYHARSPPAMPHYVPMVGVTVPSNYPRHSQHSPNLSTPHQAPPPAPAPMPPHTPSSTHSSQVIPPTPPTPQMVEHVTAVPQPLPPHFDGSLDVERKPFRPPLPWLSQPDLSFPSRAPRSRRRRRLLNADGAAVSLPLEQQQGTTPARSLQASDNTAGVTPTSQSANVDTPSTKASDAKSTPPSPTAKRAKQPEAAIAKEVTAHGDAPSASPTSSIVPALPRPASKASSTSKPQDVTKVASDIQPHAPAAVNGAPPTVEEAAAGQTAEAKSPSVTSSPAKPAPTSWANLFAKPSAHAPVGGGGSGGSVNGGGNAASAFSKTNASSLADAIRAYQVGSCDKLSFLEPRGLINTGNMCYMNSVLQVLMFCVPFYDFLCQVSKRAVHSFKSETPLVDAMVMFMHEYNVVASALSADQLQRTLKNEELEKYGEPFTPEFVYEAIRQLSRFASMRASSTRSVNLAGQLLTVQQRGHQQDAEEFLGFLLQSLNDECAHVMNSSQAADADSASVNLTASQSSTASGDWHEVGRKQRAAVTRSSGSNSSTPITKMFGGLLRSELRVPGLKDSITTEPYQPLQLDIGSPEVRNVVDALRGLTRPERLQGDFNSPRGKDVLATKQVFIESLPPVLILHLKRFQFDAEGHGTIKIWKRVGYPLELEIPREALSRQTLHAIGDGPMPRYNLISVVYHHGKNASGGHYTVDVRRQDGREWIRMDDTVLRRVRSEDVAEGGSKEDGRDVRGDHSPAAGAGNRFGAMNDQDAGDDDGWKQVTTSAGGNKRWSSVVNGVNGSAKEKQVKESIKDNKVAYLLFYQRI
ncbi:hypothetical protein RJ55_03654 [Drechmeria coniospora]|nr:hypothetical protein RJ55_03654 [Drechmeria coniospora]